MRDKKRIDRILKLIKNLWKKYPDLRFLQLIDVIMVYGDIKISDLFYIEDETLEYAIRLFIDKYYYKKND